MITKTFEQITNQTCRLMLAQLKNGILPKRNENRFNYIAAIGKRYAKNAFDYAMDERTVGIDLDVLLIPRSVYAKQV